MTSPHGQPNDASDDEGTVIGPSDSKRREIPSASSPGEFPQLIGDYRILSPLGHGALAKVYLAEDLKLGRRVALKLFERGYAEDRHDAILRQVQGQACIHHPNVCTVLAFGETEGQLYVVLSYIPGRTLLETLRDGPLPLQQAARITSSVARTMAEVHAQGFLHRDLKPSNIIIDERGEPIVGDFDLATPFPLPEESRDDGSMICGTPTYMPPEAMAGDVRAIGPASDVYSLGVVLFQLLTGSPPFEQRSIAEILQANREPCPAPSERRAGIDPTLDAICLKATARDVAARFPTMGDFAAALDVWLEFHAHDPDDSDASPLVQPPSDEGTLAVAGLLRLEILTQGQGMLVGQFPGSIELGRQRAPDEGLYSARESAPGRWRVVVARGDDITVSRKRALLTPLGESRVRVANLDNISALKLADGATLAPGASGEYPLPISLAIGRGEVRVTSAVRPAAGAGKGDEKGARAPAAPAQVSREEFERLLGERLAPPATRDQLPPFLEQVAAVAVDLLKCESSRVLRLDDERWRAIAVRGPGVRSDPSAYLLGEMRRRKQCVGTFDQEAGPDACESLAALPDLAHAAPLLDANGVVIGALYVQYDALRSLQDPSFSDSRRLELAGHLARLAAEAICRFIEPAPTPAAPSAAVSSAAAPMPPKVPPTTIHDAQFSSETVVVHFPAPIALAYRRFCQEQEPRARLERLFLAVEAILRYVSTLAVVDLLQRLAARGDEGAALPEGPAFDFLRRPVNQTLGKWLETLRAAAKALAGEPGRFIRELPEACAAGGRLDEGLLGRMIAERNRLIHAEGGLPPSRDECQESLRRVRPALDETLRELRFLRLYPLGFVTPFPHAARSGPRRYFVHSCMGSRVATTEQASLVETTAPLVPQIPFVASPDGERLLYLWPLLAQREADATQQPSLYLFEELAGKSGRNLTRVRRSAIDLRDGWEETLHEQPADDHAWLFQRIRSLPSLQPAPAELSLSARLQPSRGGELVGQRLGGNQLLAVTACGGFGAVYEARGPDGARVAVKVLETREALRQYARFQREFQKLTAASDHPGVIRCYESGDQLVGDRVIYWYSMEFADGGDLAGWIESRAQGAAGAVRADAPGSANDSLLWDDVELRPELIGRFREVASAVAHLHKLDIIHRDIKPSNALIMDDGRLCLSDFGLAKGLDPSGASLVTSTAAALGTPLYMAPEQERGEEVERTADVYALGVLLAELTTGRRPRPDTSRRQGSTLAAWPPCARLPKALREFIARLTDVDASARPATAGQVEELLSALSL